jgi:hypothetical protein
VLPVIHIGYPKTGTTTLQKALFARHPQIANLGEPREHEQALQAARAAWASCDSNPRKYRPLDRDEARALWRKALADCAPGTVPVFSKETLLLPDFYNGPADERMPRALRAVVGDVRIMIVIRQQIRMIESLFLFQAKGPKYEEPARWIEEQADKMALLDFHTLINSYASVFGRENVGVFLFEQLQNDPRDFARAIARFVGVDAAQASDLITGERHNERVSQRYLMYSKFRKKLGLYVPIGALLPARVKDRFNAFMRSGERAKFRLADDLVAKLENDYRSSNSRLAEDWNLPLRDFNYPLEAASGSR